MKSSQDLSRLNSLGTKVTFVDHWRKRAEAGLIKSMIANVHAAISHVRRAAEQLPKLDRWRALVAYICQRIVGQMALPIPPPALTAPG